MTATGQFLNGFRVAIFVGVGVLTFGGLLALHLPGRQAPASVGTSTRAESDVGVGAGLKQSSPLVQKTGTLRKKQSHALACAGGRTTMSCVWLSSFDWWSTR